MLAGCSSAVVSPTHRFRNEAPPANFQRAAVCHLQLPSTMSTQRLDLPCSFPSRSQSSVRPHTPVFSLQVGDSGRSLKPQAIKLPPSPAAAQWEVKREHTHHHPHRHQFWNQEDEEDTGRTRKRRLAVDECFVGDRVKRKKKDNSFEISDHGLDFWQEGFAVPPPPPPPFSLTPWVGSAATEITEFSEKDGETDPASSGSSSSSYGGGHIYGNTESGPVTATATATLDLEHANPGSGRPPTTATAYNGGDHGHEDEERKGFELVTLLVNCIESIGSRNIGAISHYIARLGEMASPRGRSPLARLVAYFTETLALRVTRIWPHVFHVTLPRELERADEDSGNALRLLNQVSPIPKFIHFTANEMLLRAFEGKDRVHVIDFDIKQGLQWPPFFQSLASRAEPPSHVRITGVGDSKQDLIETGRQLQGLAAALKLDFEFHPVVDRLEDVRLWMLHVKEKESVAVNCVLQLHKLLYDQNGAVFRDFVGLIRSTNPVAVVVAEQEAEHNEVNLERRICSSLRYYSAVFDSVDVSLPAAESPARGKIEEMFGREIRNMVACEGRDRFERHEGFGKWCRRMVEVAGMRSMGVSRREMGQSQMLLRMYGEDDDDSGFNVVKKEEGEGCEGLTLRWVDQPLFTVSGWMMMPLEKDDDEQQQQ